MIPKRKNMYVWLANIEKSFRRVLIIKFKKHIKSHHKQKMRCNRSQYILRNIKVSMQFLFATVERKLHYHQKELYTQFI